METQQQKHHQPQPQLPGSALSRWFGPIGFGIALAAGVAWLVTRGLDEDVPAVSAVAAVVWMIIVAGGLAAAYVAGAVGLGRIAAWGLLGASPSRTWIQGALGLGLMLLLSHLLGMLGLLGGAWGMYIGWGVVGIGVLVLTDQVVRAELRPENWSVLPGWGVLVAPGLAVMLVAAANPPGVMWNATEHGQYDVLSYHLQLPKEWLESGWLWPLEHNVYSFLPSYMESAFMHLGAMARVLGGEVGGTGGAQYIGDEGVGLIAAQMLHVAVGLLAAGLVGRLVWTFLTARAVGERTAAFAGSLAAAVLISTPWVVVVGSMAYNELAVLALGAGAMLAAVERGAGGGAGGGAPVRRAIAAGALVGLACSAKPTAAFMVGPVVGLLLLGMATRAEWEGGRGRVWLWGKMAAWGSGAGVAAMLPWLVRNTIASGNPVFPFASGLFGRGHWSAEQVERHARGHHFSGDWVARIDTLLSSQRGIAHEQWFILFGAGAAGLVVALFWRRTRRPAALLLGGLGALLGAWLWLTHLQSRFLLPAAPILAAGVGLGAATLIAAVAQGIKPGVPPRRWLAVAAAVICTGVPVALAVRTVNMFLAQHDGRPSAALHFGVGAMTYLREATDYHALPAWDQRQVLAQTVQPEPYANLTIPPEEVVYLIGDATPLYYAGRVLYHTTWDESPLGRLMADHPGTPEGPMGERWARELHARGVRHIVVNFAELQRLVEVDGWYDPNISRPAVERWADRWCEPVHAWPERGQFLLRLPEPAPAEGSAP